MDSQVIYFCTLIKNVIHSSKESQMEDIDWNYQVQLAKQHNLLPIFYEGAIKQVSFMDTPEYATEMRVVLSSVMAQAKRTSAFLQLYEEFAQAGIYPIVMKGLICRELYGKLCDHRPSGDEDILIRLSEYWKVKDILIAKGYVSTIEGETQELLEQVQEVSFVHPTEKLHIELHLNPMGRENEARSRMSDYFMNSFENYREVEIHGVKIRTMSHQVHLLYLILHAFKHFIRGGFGIRQMLDILLYQEKYGAEVDLKQIQDNLRNFKADIFWSDIIHIGNSYFGFQLPTIQKPKSPRELLEDAIQSGVFGNSAQADIMAAKAVTLATEDYLNDKKNNQLVTMLRTIFPQKSYLLQQAPYLEEAPWLLPVAWVKRWRRFIKQSRNNRGNLAIQSVKISQRRMKMLKKYNLM